MTRFITGFYHDSPLWIDDEPLITAETLDVAAMQREVFRQRLECGLEMLVTCDGLFAFDFSGLPTTQTITTAATADFDMSAKEALQQTQIMNAYLMLLYTALRQENLPEPHHLLVVTPHLRIGLHEFSATAQLTVHWRVAHLVNSRAVSSYARAVDYRLDERIKYRTGPIPARLVAVAAEALDRLIQSQGTEGTALLDMCLHAEDAYREHDYSLGLVMYWAICEALVSRLWERFQKDNTSRGGRPYITAERRKALTDTRTYTASVMTETLQLAGILPLEVYWSLTTARKARNNWAHSLKPADRSVAAEAAGACEALFALVLGVSLNCGTGISLHGV